MARSIDIQSINFAVGSAAISSSQYDKIENIADALQRIPRGDPGARVLTEGHTDAVGPSSRTRPFSEQRAASLKRTPVRELGVPGYALETVGYGEDFLPGHTQNENWQNRSVTLRRFDDFILLFVSSCLALLAGYSGGVE